MSIHRLVFACVAAASPLIAVSNASAACDPRYYRCPPGSEVSAPLSLMQFMKPQAQPHKPAAKRHVRRPAKSSATRVAKHPPKVSPPPSPAVAAAAREPFKELEKPAAAATVEPLTPVAPVLAYDQPNALDGAASRVHVVSPNELNEIDAAADAALPSAAPAPANGAGDEGALGWLQRLFGKLTQ